MAGEREPSIDRRQFFKRARDVFLASGGTLIGGSIIHLSTEVVSIDEIETKVTENYHRPTEKERNDSYRILTKYKNKNPCKMTKKEEAEVDRANLISDREIAFQIHFNRDVEANNQRAKRDILDIIRNREPIIGIKSEAYYENRFL